MSRIIGIDLGTTYSVLAVYEEDGPRIITNEQGQRQTRSMVAFCDNNKWLVGEPAKNQQVTNPASTIYSIKRFMGRRHREVISEEKIVPYPVVGKPDEFVKVKVGRKHYTPQEISAIVLRELKRTAEVYLGEEVNRAVITVPAYFNDSQRQATKDAGLIAGLKVERIINEPTAAALAYGLEKRQDKCIVVFDFGGGTFDLAIMNIGGGTFDVRAVHGNSHLGGDDFDQRIIDIVADDFRRKERVDLRNEPMALQRLKDAAEKAKHELSSRNETDIMLPFISVDGEGPKHLQHTMTREVFNGVCTDLFEEIRQGCKVLLKSAGLTGRDIAEVVMVGGSTRIPKVQEIAKEVFETDELDKSINPDEVVAAGAAILGGVIAGDLVNVQLQDVTSNSLGIETYGGRSKKLIGKNTGIPTSTKEVFTTPRDNQTSVPINVLEGEGEVAKYNRTLGLFQLTGIPKARRGTPQVEVEFAIDSDGILHVAATEKKTGKSQKVIIEGAVGLDRNELERMKREVSKQDESKEENRQAVDLKNHAQGVLHDVRKWLSFHHQLMPTRSVDQLETVLKRLEKKIASGDNPGIKAALKKLDEIYAPLRKAG